MIKDENKVADKESDVRTVAEFNNPAAVARLTPAQYWEWRTTIEEKSHEDTRVKIAELRKQLTESRLSEAKLNVQIATFMLKDALDKQRKISEDCQAFRVELERDLGVSLKECTIDPVFYEIIPRFEETKEA